MALHLPMKTVFKKILLVAGILPVLSCSVFHKAGPNLNKTAWIHGAADCKQSVDPPIQVVQYNANTWILRESKCVHYEGPFMFLFIGHQRALLMDDGATFDAKKFPLRVVVDSLIVNWEKANNIQVALTIAHTHSHGDHTAGDGQFKDRPNTTVVGLKVDDVIAYFQLQNWPTQTGQINLGERKLDIIPIPGHHATSIAVYDHETRILLSGDSFYPGRLYIKDWPAFKASTQRLTDFAAHHKISWILGNHIEMSKNPGVDYPIGSNYQPDEHILPLTVKDLVLLNETLKGMDKPERKVLNDFIIYPI